MTTDIYRDAWGVPHLRAGDAHALARLQGSVTARDRAWQLETERHRARGTSASFLGPEALPWDLFARRARLDDTARRCFDELGSRDPETADWVRAYADGVNEGLAGADAPEFTRTGLEPGRWEPWTPLAVWLATHILFAGFPAKLWREEAARHLGPEAVGLFAADGPGTSGSNGWLVSGERTVTGQAVIAGDPHRFIEDPGVYQQIRLACDEFDVVGLAVPGVPGIAHFGHTGTVAWAITNAMADYQDLYRERLRRTGAGVEALGPDGAWRRVARHTEQVRVAGEETVEVEVLETERGPVIAGGPEGLDDGTPLALALRYPPRVTADLGFEALLPLLRARRVADVDRAFDRWAEPVNVVQAADTEGGLLHRVAGRVPLRAAANGTRLVPAWEPGHEWTGWHDMPRAGLTDGLAVMANQRGPATELGVEFAPPHRADRIRALLEERRQWSAADMPAIHTDTRLASAAPLLDHLSALDDLTGQAGELRDRLLRWDRRMDADSREASAFAALRSALVRRLAAHPAFAALTTPPAYPEVLLPGWPWFRASASPSNTFCAPRSCTASTAPRWYGRPSRRSPGSRPPAGATPIASPPGGRCPTPPGRPRPWRATTTVCCAPRPCPAGPTSPRAARPPVTCGTWPAARTACGWSRSARPASPTTPTTATSSPVAQGRARPGRHRLGAADEGERR